MTVDTLEPAATETADRPVEAVDYGVLNATWALLMTGMVLATYERGQRDPIRGAELAPIAAATFALSKVVAKEKIGSWVREPFVEVRDGEPRPRGERMRHAVGELVTCSRCLGAWTAMGIVGLRLASPPAGRAVTSVLAAAAANDFMQASFRYVCANANRAQND